MLPLRCCPGPGNCPGRSCRAPPLPIALGLRLPEPLSRPALSGAPNPALWGKFSLVALVGAPIMPSASPRPAVMLSPPGVMPEYMEPPPPPGGMPRAERSMPFMRMYWYFERWSMWVYVAMGRGLWRARAAIMASFSSSESTAPDGSRSSGRGALASIKEPRRHVSLQMSRHTRM
jgi:hypothetical protein